MWIKKLNSIIIINPDNLKSRHFSRLHCILCRSCRGRQSDISERSGRVTERSDYTWMHDSRSDGWVDLSKASCAERQKPGITELSETDGGNDSGTEGQHGPTDRIRRIKIMHIVKKHDKLMIKSALVEEKMKQLCNRGLIYVRLRLCKPQTRFLPLRWLIAVLFCMKKCEHLIVGFWSKNMICLIAFTRVSQMNLWIKAEAVSCLHSEARCWMFSHAAVWHRSVADVRQPQCWVWRRTVKWLAWSSKCEDVRWRNLLSDRNGASVTFEIHWMLKRNLGIPLKFHNKIKTWACEEEPPKSWAWTVK